MRQKSGSVVCPSCGRLVGVNDETCFHCGRPRPGMWGFTPLLRKLGADFAFPNLVIGACALLYVLTLVAGGFGGGQGMAFLSPTGGALVAFGASGPLPVFQFGRWWTVLSAGWLHAGVIHILFNMLWVRQLAPETAAVYGMPRTVVIYVGSSVIGFVASTFGGVLGGPLSFIMGGAPDSITVGASAAIFGLLGAVVYAGSRGVASELGRQAWIWAVVLFVFGLLWPGIDNWAHLGGFAGGWLLGRALDPMSPERIDHMLAALVCLVASLGAVGWSVVTAL